MQQAQHVADRLLARVEGVEPDVLERVRRGLAQAFAADAEARASVEAGLAARCNPADRERVQACLQREGPAAAHALAVRLGRRRALIERRRVLRKARGRRPTP